MQRASLSPVATLKVRSSKRYLFLRAKVASGREKPASALTRFGPRTFSVDRGALSFFNDLHTTDPNVGHQIPGSRPHKVT